MLYPSVDEMTTKLDSKYSLVVAVSKRARLLREGTKSHIQHEKSFKHVGIALEEIYEGLITYDRTK